ncbi:MAG: hypothetical protein JNL81_13120 [Hyphomonadaceae bacterium]|nr:hypothetical protein [Hyphomonadaceae bacterium]
MSSAAEAHAASNNALLGIVAHMFATPERRLWTLSWLTLLTLAFYGYSDWYFRLPLIAIAVGLTMWPRFAGSAVCWGLLALLATVAVVLNWHVADNHKIVLCYWVWAMLLAHSCASAGDAEKLLRANARFLLTLIMFGAIVQKTLSPDYLSGDFFEFMLLSDPRLAALLGFFGVPATSAAETQFALNALSSSYVTVEGGRLQIGVTPTLTMIALAATWWNYGAQIVLDALGVWGRRWTDTLYHCLMIVFIATTYFIAPVIGFGWLLVLLGLTLAGRGRPMVCAAYLASLVLLTLYDIPWRGL